MAAFPIGGQQLGGQFDLSPLAALRSLDQIRRDCGLTNWSIDPKSLSNKEHKAFQEARKECLTQFQTVLNQGAKFRCEVLEMLQQLFEYDPLTSDTVEGLVELLEDMMPIVEAADRYGIIVEKSLLSAYAAGIETLVSHIAAGTRHGVSKERVKDRLDSAVKTLESLEKSASSKDMFLMLSIQSAKEGIKRIESTKSDRRVKVIVTLFQLTASAASKNVEEAWKAAVELFCEAKEYAEARPQLWYTRALLIKRLFHQALREKTLSSLPTKSSFENIQSCIQAEAIRERGRTKNVDWRVFIVAAQGFAKLIEHHPSPEIKLWAMESQVGSPGLFALTRFPKVRTANNCGQVEICIVNLLLELVVKIEDPKIKEILIRELLHLLLSLDTKGESQLKDVIEEIREYTPLVAEEWDKLSSLFSKAKLETLLQELKDEKSEGERRRLLTDAQFVAWCEGRKELETYRQKIYNLQQMLDQWDQWRQSITFDISKIDKVYQVGMSPSDAVAQLGQNLAEEKSNFLAREAALNKKIEDLEAKEEECKKKMQGKEEECLMLLQQVEADKQTLAEEKEKNLKKVQELSDELKQLEELKKEIIRYEQDVKEKERELEELESKLRIEKERGDKLAGELKNIQQQQQKVDSENHQAASDISQLKQNAQKREEELSTLKKKLEIEDRLSLKDLECVKSEYQRSGRKLGLPQICWDQTFKTLLWDAVVTPEGHTYSERKIRTHLETSHCDPITKNPLHIDQLVPRQAIRDLVQDLCGFDTKSREELLKESSAYVLGADKWALLGDPQISYAIPESVRDILITPCPFSNGKERVFQTHFLAWIPSRNSKKEPFNLSRLAALAKEKRLTCDIWQKLNEILQRESFRYENLPYWLLITRNVAPHTRGKTYVDQAKWVASFTNYRTPRTLEVTMVALLNFVESPEKRSFLGDKQITRCREYSKYGTHAAVTFINQNKLELAGSGYDISSDNIGMVAVRRFDKNGNELK